MDFNPLTAQALAAFESLYPRILALVRERLELELGKATGRFDRRQEELLKECFIRFGETLKAVYAFGLYEVLAEETSWLISALESRGLGPGWREKILETWTIGIQALVKPPEAEGLSRPLLQTQTRIPRVAPARLASEEEISEDVQKYLDFTLGNKRREAAEFALALLERGFAPAKVADNLIMPALRQIGLLWEKNKISSATEHLSTEIIRYVIYRLFDSIPRKKGLNFSVVLACAPGDEHDIGIELMANLLAGEGWSVNFIGRGAPHQDFMETVLRIRPDIVFLSVSLVSHLPAAHSLVLDLTKRAPEVAIILGGAAAIKATNLLSPIVAGIAGGIEDGQRLAVSLVKTDA